MTSSAGVATSTAPVPKQIQKIISSINKKEIKVLELQSELERKKVKEEYHEFYDLT